MALDRHLLLLHRLEERALDLRGGPVDLVGQEDVGEDRALPKLKLPLLHVEDEPTHYVKREHVWRELDAAEVQFQATREALCQQRLRDAGDAFEQNVPPCQQGRQEQLRLPLLADYNPAELGDDPVAQTRGH